MDTSKRIKIPGSLKDDQQEKNYGAGNSEESDEVTSQNEDEIRVDDDAATESDEFVSDIDEEIHKNADTDRQSRNKKIQEKRILPPDQLLTRSQILAKRFAARGHVNNSLRQLIRQTALSVLVYGPNHWQYANSYAQLAKGYLDLKGINFAQQAAEHAEHAKNILLGLQAEENIPQSEIDRLELLKISLNTYHTLGRSQSLLKKFSDAEQSLLKADKIVKELSKLTAVDFDFLQESRIKVWTALAKISNKQNKPAISISYYEQAIAASEKRFGNGAAELVPLYQAIGHVEQSRAEFANHERAIDFYVKAHEIATTLSEGQYTELTGSTSRALATAYSRCGSDKSNVSAMSYLQESLAAYLQLHGPHNAIVCEVQDELAKLMIRDGRCDEGQKQLQQTLKVKANVFGDYSAEVLESYRLLGSLQLSQGLMEKSFISLQRAKDIAEFLYGANCKVSKDLNSTINTLLKHPSMEGKQMGHEMKNRPRFNGIVGRSKAAPASNTSVF